VKSLFNVYKNKKIFVTGATGFKGSWLVLWLNSLGAEVMGYSLEPNTEPSMFNELNISSKIHNVFGNILDKEKLEKTMLDFNPDVVFHLAAQPLVRLSYSEPLLTYETNVIGTLNVLESARKCSNIKAFVNVTTDKCYENKEIERGYTEDEAMGGHDMYSSSKGCVEIMSSSYRRSFLQGGEPYAMATVRSGNIIGGGDWAVDRLVPDCIRAIEGDAEAKRQRGKEAKQSKNYASMHPGIFASKDKSYPIIIRNPYAVRPWQHVLEPLSGYLLLGEKLLNQGQKYAQGFNFGPNDDSVLTVADVAQRVVNYYGKGEVIVSKNDDLHEANLLMLNIEKAKSILGWTPRYSADEAIQATVEWYKRFYSGEDEDMIKFSLKQIESYQSRCNLLNVGLQT